MKELSRELGYSVEFQKTSWSSLENDLNSGMFDVAIGGISLTQHRKTIFLTSIPIMNDGKIPLINHKYKDVFKKFEDIDQEKTIVIVNSGGTNELFAKQHIKQAKILVWDDNNAIFDKIAKDEAHAMITDRAEALYRQSTDSRLIAVNPSELLTESTYGFLYPQQNRKLRDEIDIALERIMKSEKFEEMKNKFFGMEFIF